MDRLEEWRVFMTVARLASFSEAARALGRSPQAVTRAVAALEARLGTRLLHRTTRSVSLTSDGELYCERSRRALAEFDLLEAGRDAPLAGRVSLTAPVLFGQLHVLPAVTEFLSGHRDIDLHVVLLDRVVSLAEEGFDLGVRIGSLPDSSLRARLLGCVRSVLCANPSYLKREGVPQTPAALANHTCIAFTATTPNIGRWSFPSSGRRESTVAVRAQLVVNTGQAAIDAAVAGLGIVRVLSYQIARLVSEGKLQIILTAYERKAAPIHFVHLPGRQPKAAAAFMEFAAERIRARLSAGI